MAGFLRFRVQTRGRNRPGSHGLLIKPGAAGMSSEVLVRIARPPLAEGGGDADGAADQKATEYRHAESQQGGKGRGNLARTQHRHKGSTNNTDSGIVHAGS